MHESDVEVTTTTKGKTMSGMGAVSVSLEDDGNQGLNLAVAVDEDPPDYSEIVPMGDFVLIWPVAAPNKKGSIIIPEGAKTTEIKRDEGTILQVGPDCKCGLIVGDHVYYYRHAGSWQVAPEADGKLVRLMKDVEVYGRRKRENEKTEATPESDPGPPTVPSG